MRQNKEQFKPKNRDENYIKDKHPDIQFGRHTEFPQTKPITLSKKNRMYQSRQEPQTETAAVNTETLYALDIQTDLSEPEQQEFSENVENEQFSDIPKSKPPKQTPKAKRRLYHQHTQNIKKSANLDIPQEPPPPPKTEDYNIRDVVQDNKTEFSRNTDIDFSETAADRDSNIKELDILFEHIYEDNVSGKISDERFAKMSVKYESEQKEIHARADELQRELDNEKSKAVMSDMFLASVRKYTRAKKLTLRMLNKLIDKIEVYQAEQIDGERVQRLKIHHNCIGMIEIPDLDKLSEINVSVHTRQGVDVHYAAGAS